MQTFQSTAWRYITNLSMSTSHKTQESHFREKLIEGNSHSGLGDERAVHHSVCHGVGVGGNSDPSPENRWVKCTEYVPWSTRKFSRKQTLGCCNGVGLPRELRPGKIKEKETKSGLGNQTTWLFLPSLFQCPEEFRDKDGLMGRKQGVERAWPLVLSHGLGRVEDRRAPFRNQYRLQRD